MYLKAADDLHQGDAEVALKRATYLVSMIEAVLTRKGLTRRLRPEAALEDFARGVEDECLLLYAGAHLVQANGEDGPRSQHLISGSVRLDRVKLRKRFQQRLYDEKPADVTSRDVRDFVVNRGSRPPLSPRAHYNMGCLLAQTGAYQAKEADAAAADQEAAEWRRQSADLRADEARVHVLTAIEGDQPVPLEWVRRDPSLGWLRGTPQWEEVAAAVAERLERRGRAIGGATG
jgi:hypothetical protein